MRQCGFFFKKKLAVDSFKCKTIACIATLDFENEHHRRCMHQPWHVFDTRPTFGGAYKISNSYSGSMSIASHGTPKLQIQNDMQQIHFPLYTQFQSLTDTSCADQPLALTIVDHKVVTLALPSGIGWVGCISQSDEVTTVAGLVALAQAVRQLLITAGLVDQLAVCNVRDDALGQAQAKEYSVESA